MMSRRIGAKAEKHVKKQYLDEIQTVEGKQRLLRQVAEAALAGPEKTIRAGIFPVVSEEKCKAILKEYQAKGEYQEQVYQRMRASYRDHYRRMVPLLVNMLDVRSNNTAHRPVADALVLVKRYAGVPGVYYPVDETVPIAGVVRPMWHDLVLEKDKDAAPGRTDAANLVGNAQGRHVHAARLPARRGHPAGSEDGPACPRTLRHPACVCGERSLLPGHSHASFASLCMRVATQVNAIRRSEAQSMSWLEVVLRLVVALACGAAIGIERQYRQHSAGLRTSALVATGSALFVLVAALTPNGSNRTGVAAQVVSGVGFLCAGVIIRDGFNIRGLNTAGTLWCASGVGVLAGAGDYLVAALGAVMVLLANLLLRPLARFLDRHSKTTGDTGEIPIHYVLRAVCLSQQENRIRSLLLQSVSGRDLTLQALQSADTQDPTRALQLHFLS